MNRKPRRDNKLLFGFSRELRLTNIAGGVKMWIKLTDTHIV